MKWAKKAYILYVSRHGGRETAERGIPVRAGLGRGLHCRGVTGARAGGRGAGIRNMEKLITQYKIPTLPRTLFLIGKLSLGLTERQLLESLCFKTKIGTILKIDIYRVSFYTLP